MVAPKCPGTEVREEYKRGFGVPTLIAVHPETIRKAMVWRLLKHGLQQLAVTVRVFCNRLFVAEVKSDLMGEQTILCAACCKLVLSCATKNGC